MPWQRRPRPLHFYVYWPHEGGTTMTEQSNSERTAPATSETNGCDGSAASMPESSRRHFLKASAALAAGVTAAQALPGDGAGGIRCRAQLCAAAAPHPAQRRRGLDA